MDNSCEQKGRVAPDQLSSSSDFKTVYSILKWYAQRVIISEMRSLKTNVYASVCISIVKNYITSN